MGQVDFQKRLERIQHTHAGSNDQAKASSTHATSQKLPSPMAKFVARVAFGFMGFISSLILAFTAANYDNLKADLQTEPEFVQAVYAATGVSAIVFVVFVLWGTIALIKFRRGLIRNVILQAFFIGAALNSLSLKFLTLG